MQEKILNFDNLLKNVHLKISGNQETEKVLTKIEEKAKEEEMCIRDRGSANQQVFLHLR